MAKAVKKEVEDKTTQEEPASSKNEVPQEVVKEESSQKTTSEQETPADASIGTEEEVKGPVPYERVQELSKKNRELRDRNEFLEGQAEEQPEPLKPPMSNEIPQLDPDSEAAVNVAWEKRKAAEFAQKHEKELKDPVLAGTTLQIIRRANAEGKVIDQEAALSQAKKILDERVKPQANQAKQEGVEEGKEVTRKKEQAQAIGDTKEHPEIDENKLNAEEWAKHKGLKYAE